MKRKFFGIRKSSWGGDLWEVYDKCTNMAVLEDVEHREAQYYADKKELEDAAHGRIPTKRVPIRRRR